MGVDCVFSLEGRVYLSCMYTGFRAWIAEARFSFYVRRPLARPRARRRNHQNNKKVPGDIILLVLSKIITRFIALQRAHYHSWMKEKRQ